jgi:hypothetical protein
MGHLITTQAVAWQHDTTVGQRLRNISIALAIVVTALWLYMWLYAGTLFVFAACFVASGWLYRFLAFRSKQYLARSKPADSLDDPRPPVVLLRPFLLDAHYSGWGGQVLQQITTVPQLSITDVFSWDLVLRNLPTFEEYIAKSLHAIGPLVALGRPEEALPPPGAARLSRDRPILEKSRCRSLKEGTCCHSDSWRKPSVELGDHDRIPRA